MTVDTRTLIDYKGKDVVLKLVGEDETIEGHVEQASEVGIAFKRKGRRDVEPIFPDALESINVAEKKVAALKQKKTLPVTTDKVKSHLLNAHGYYVSAINGLSPEEAEKEHDSIDHSDLGHNHDKTTASDEQDTDSE